MRVLLALAVAATTIAGCLGGPDHADGDAAACLPAPHPCGDTGWPADLAGPFTLQAGMPQRITVQSHDGTDLGGFLYLPQLPDGVLAPTLLVSSPYFGLDMEVGSDLGGIGETMRYVEAGYAVVGFSVRGTGVSGGCFENKGREEQLDQAFLVEWLASQPWSNGRIAMGGTSYPGTTPFMAANLQPPHLVTILPNGPVTDPYTELHTPQGALYTMGGPYEAGRRGLVTAAQLSNLDPGDGLLPAAVTLAPERLCPDLVQVLAGAEKGQFIDDRDGAFWRERQLIMGFPNITAAVFLSHGLDETAHPFQEDPVWEALDRAPKRMLLGQWDHQLPDVNDWQGLLLAWLDYWLKGVGDVAPGLGVVTYQDDGGAWHESSSWPPAEATDESLYLNAGQLSRSPATPGDGGSFRSVPPAPRTAPDAPREQLCGTAPPGTGLVFDGEPVAASTLVAGNPFLFLNLESDQPGGLVAAHLFAGDGDCRTARLLSSGVADLRFHDGVFVGHDFHTGMAMPVRIDLLDLAEPVAAGEHLSLVLSFGDTFSTGEVADPLTDARFSHSGQPYVPLLTVHAGSELVLPVVGRTLGGTTPVGPFPPRPFVP
ncbi:MAG: X-Pro dipeptidyl-peptidase [Thermoplasmata archaeon]|nr:X-Pro dipeptidyl-peptidase [Thermoplasmata archaeon]